MYTTINGTMSQFMVSRTSMITNVITYRLALTVNIPCRLICIGPGVGPWMVGLTRGVNPTSTYRSKSREGC